MPAPQERTTRQLALLAALVKQRRMKLGFSNKEDAAKACGLSHVPYRNVEAGRGGVSDTTYAKIETGFEFVAGSCQAVLNGADSIKLLDGTELIHRGQITHPSLEEAPGMAKRAISSAAAESAPELTHRQTDEMAERAVKELQRLGIIPSGS